MVNDNEVGMTYHNDKFFTNRGLLIMLLKQFIVFVFDLRNFMELSKILKEFIIMEIYILF